MLGRVLLACVALAGCHENPSQRGKLLVTYSVDLTRAVEEKAVEVQLDLQAALADQRVAASVTTNVSGISVTPPDGSTRSTIEQIVKTNYGEIVEARPCDVDVPSYAACFRIAPGYARAVEKAALDRAIATVRARLEVMKVPNPNVVEKGGEIVVELPTTKDRGIAIREVLARTGKLEIKVVDDGSPYMEKLYRHVSEARDAEVTAEVENWNGGGKNYSDYYLVAHDADGVSGRVVLERYLTKLAETDPSLRVPTDRQIGFERLPERFEAKDRRPAWRTYYLERAPRLTGSSIADASGDVDEVTNRPFVRVDFNRRGAQTFGDLTAAVAGHKLAILIDDRIQSAPVVMEAIRGGRIQITLGGNDPKAMKAERDELTKVLKTGALPAPLVEESLIEVP